MDEKVRSGDDVINLTSRSEAPRSELKPSPKGDSRTRGSLQSISQCSLPKLPDPDKAAITPADQQNLTAKRSP